MEEPLKYFFISRGTPAYENVYRPEKVDTGKLLSRKCICKELLHKKYVSLHCKERN
jgi:hypothetical protein